MKKRVKKAKKIQFEKELVFMVFTQRKEVSEFKNY